MYDGDFKVVGEARELLKQRFGNDDEDDYRPGMPRIVYASKEIFSKRTTLLKTIPYNRYDQFLGLCNRLVELAEEVGRPKPLIYGIKTGKDYCKLLANKKVSVNLKEVPIDRKVEINLNETSLDELVNILDEFNRTV